MASKHRRKCSARHTRTQQLLHFAQVFGVGETVPAVMCMHREATETEPVLVSIGSALHASVVCALKRRGQLDWRHHL